MPWDRDRFKCVLTAKLDRGETYLGPAYKITGGKRGQGTIAYLADDVLNRLWRAREHMSPKCGTSLEAYCNRLMDFAGVGSFMAAQVVADLKYVEPLRSAPDWMTFVASGPGSRRGLNRIMGRPVDEAWTETAWRAAFRRFEAAIRPELQRLDLAELHCQDLQNCLCEVDKYLRCKLGEGKPKRRFTETVAV